MVRYLTHFQIRVEKIWQTWLGRELHYLCSCCCFRLNINCQRLKPGPQLHRVAGDAAIWISFTPEAVLSPQQDRGARRQCFRWRWGNPGNVCQLCFYPQNFALGMSLPKNPRDKILLHPKGSCRLEMGLKWESLVCLRFETPDFEDFLKIIA